jgi:hypothetical protein
MSSRDRPKTRKLNKRLTAKQERFVEEVASGDNATLVESYEKAGYTMKGKRRSATNQASRMTRNPYIAPAIEERERAVAQEARAGMIASRRYVLQRLREEADNLDSRASERISALALLAKASGALDDASERESKRSTATEAELAAELQARLHAMSPELAAVDVTATQDSVADELHDPVLDDHSET